MYATRRLIVVKMFVKFLKKATVHVAVIAKESGTDGQEERTDGRMYKVTPT